MRNFGIVLVVIGIISILTTGVDFVTPKEVGAGTVEVTKEADQSKNWSPLVGGVLLISGLVLLFANRGDKSYSK